jgi:hypothetical protein
MEMFHTKKEKDSKKGILSEILESNSKVFGSILEMAIQNTENEIKNEMKLVSQIEKTKSLLKDYKLDLNKYVVDSSNFKLEDILYDVEKMIRWEGDECHDIIKDCHLLNENLSLTSLNLTLLHSIYSLIAISIDDFSVIFTVFNVQQQAPMMIKGLLKHFKFEIDNKIPVVLDKIYSQLHFEMSKILLSVIKSTDIEPEMILDLNRALQLQIQRNNVETSKNLLLCVLLCPMEDNFAIIQTVLKALHSIF